MTLSKILSGFHVYILVNRPYNQSPATTAVVLSLETNSKRVFSQRPIGPSPPSIGIILPTTLNLCSNNSASREAHGHLILETHGHTITLTLRVPVLSILYDFIAETFVHIIRADSNLPLWGVVGFHPFVSTSQSVSWQPFMKEEFAYNFHFSIWPSVSVITFATFRRRSHTPLSSSRTFFRVATHC